MDKTGRDLLAVVSPQDRHKHMPVCRLAVLVTRSHEGVCSPMRVNKARRNPLVLAVDHLDTRCRSNVLLDASDRVALDEHVRLVNACVLAALHASRDNTAFKQVIRHVAEWEVG